MIVLVLDYKLHCIFGQDVQVKLKKYINQLILLIIYAL